MKSKRKFISLIENQNLNLNIWVDAQKLSASNNIKNLKKNKKNWEIDKKFCTAITTNLLFKKVKKAFFIQHFTLFVFKTM